jgi:rhamnopyranosyl-N-acetylglucosaminyl-diphospho-decaprenol beta-1,3/1,4-galactofuranosyltransferase
MQTAEVDRSLILSSRDTRNGALAAVRFDSADQAAETSAAIDTPRVVAVVVSYRRHDQLATLLGALEQQSVALERIIVVDNDGTRETANVIQQHPIVEHINGRKNLGGAGGFAYGMLHALAEGADLVWVMDDDGCPASDDTLAGLIAGLRSRNWDAASPLVVDAEDPAKLAFPLRVGLKFLSRTASVRSRGVIPRFAHLFNGLLISSDALMRVGVPDMRLAIRGDEVDFMHRMRRAGVRFGTLATVEFRHPSSNAEIVPLIPGVLHVVWPRDSVKRERFFVNRGYLIRTHGLWMVLLRDLVCYPWFFLVTRRGDALGLAQWIAQLWRGSHLRFISSSLRQ